MPQVSWLDDSHKQDHSQRSAGEEPKEGETVFTRVESVITLKDERVRFEEEVHDTVDERHVERDGHEHRFEGEHDEGFEEDGVESVLERVTSLFH